MQDTLRVTVIATGFEAAEQEDVFASPVTPGRRGEMPASAPAAAPPPPAVNEATYQGHEKFNDEAYARLQALNKGTSNDDASSGKARGDRLLDVPTFFRRRSRRR